MSSLVSSNICLLPENKKKKITNNNSKESKIVYLHYYVSLFQIYRFDDLSLVNWETFS